jgi:hypothetical protein
MTKTKKFFIFLILLIILIQFIPIPKNNGIAKGPQDISHAVSVSPAIENILSKSCYDCHSDHTNYLWYFRIQPFAWWLNDHIEEGKNELNFSVFNTYSQKRKLKKFQEIIDEVSEGEMPLYSYALIHKDAILSVEQKTALIEWASINKKAFQAN